MPAAAPAPRIFLSYARSDGEAFARALRRRLESEGFSLWQDRTRMEGGKDWWEQIDAALRVVEYMVLVLTPAAVRSDIVVREWRLARQRGVCVIPVFGVGENELDLAPLPRWMREATSSRPKSRSNGGASCARSRGPARSGACPSWRPIFQNTSFRGRASSQS